MRVVLLLLAWIAAAPASASSTEITWQGLTISRDTDVWRIALGRDADAVVFTCIAGDCPGQPSVHARAWKTTEKESCPADLPGIDRDARSIPLGNAGGRPPAISFSAVSRWSGCRALDAPILEACGEHAGMTYRFTTWPGNGCNRGPEMPEGRFRDLIRAIRPAP